MGNDEVVKTPVSALQELCERAKVSDDAKALLSEDTSTKEFIAVLVEKELLKDAIRMIAYLLPRREAIGWGCLCVRHALAAQNAQPPAIQAATERWVAAPTEENRWAAKKMADVEKPRTPSGLLALGVFFAGPSIAPPQHPKPIPPPPALTAVMVSNAVLLAGVIKEPKKAKEKYGVFMQKAGALLARMQQQATQS